MSNLNTKNTTKLKLLESVWFESFGGKWRKYFKFFMFGSICRKEGEGSEQNPFKTHFLLPQIGVFRRGGEEISLKFYCIVKIILKLI